MRTVNYTRRWLASKVHSVVLLVACIMGLALFGVSCKSSQKVSESSFVQAREKKTEDTVHEMRILTTQKVRADTATLNLNPQNLRNLPHGASYARRSGRANVVVQRKDSLIYVTATCDSLWQMVELYEIKARRYEQEAQQWKHLYTYRQSKTSGFFPRTILIAVGLFVLGSGAWLYLNLFEKKQINK